MKEIPEKDQHLNLPFDEIEKELEKFKDLLAKDMEEKEHVNQTKRAEALQRIDKLACTTLEEVQSEWGIYEEKLEQYKKEETAKLEQWFSFIETEIGNSDLVPSLVDDCIASLCKISEQQER